MTDINKDDMVEFGRSVERLSKVLERLPSGNSSGNTMTVHVGVGPVAAGIMFGMCLVLALVLFRQDERIDTMQDYINSIFVNSPQLNPDNQNGAHNYPESKATEAATQSPAGTDAAQEKEVIP